MKIYTSAIASTLVLLLGITGCGLTDNMDRMRDLTEELAHKTDGMSETTDGLYEANLYLIRMARQGGALTSRSDAYNKMTEQKISLENRMAMSAVFYRSFEFQLFLGDGRLDLPEDRQILFGEAAEELIHRFSGLINGKRPEANPLSTNPNVQAMFALSATLEQFNSLQFRYAKKYGFPLKSVLDLIVDTVKNKDLPSSELPAYAKKFLANNNAGNQKKGALDDISFMLEMRQNIFSAVVLDKLFGAGRMGLIDKLKLILGGSVKIDFALHNESELNEITYKYLYGALFARELMRESGNPIVLNKMTKKILKKAQFKEDPLATGPKRDVQEKFKAGFAALLCEDPGCKNNIPTTSELERITRFYSWTSTSTYFDDQVAAGEAALAAEILKRQSGL